MTDSATAWDKHHSHRANPAHKQRVVVGGADHCSVGEFILFSRFDHSLDDARRACRRSIRIDPGNNYLQVSLLRHARTSLLDFAQYAVPALLVGVADINFHLHPAGNTVRSFGTDLALAHVS